MVSQSDLDWQIWNLSAMLLCRHIWTNVIVIFVIFVSKEEKVILFAMNVKL